MMKFQHLPIVLLVVSLLVEFCESKIAISPQVTIPSGILIGEVGPSMYRRDFYKFWCIPYGKAERFEPSVPADNWTGVRDATSCIVRCTQFPIIGLNIMEFYSQEDCLVLNVFVPKDHHQSNPLPVMVYVHGGYFWMGSSLDYSGELFMDENVVLVTINYRLGAFGFLATGDGVIEANLGLKDQVLAFKWVQKNIRYFGGDPDRVTIFGESAGAGSVSFQVLSPMSKGLFQHAIAESGSSLCAWSYQSRPEHTFSEFVKRLNCSFPTTQESVTCLKKKSAKQIVKATSSTKWFIELTFPIFPSVEWVTPKNGEIFLPDHPRRLMETGNFNRVPFIIGVNEDEGAYQGGLLIDDHGLLDDLNTDWIKKAAIGTGMDTRNITSSNLNKGLRKLRHFYFGDEDISVKHIYNVTDMFSDAWFVAGFKHTIVSIANYAPVYPYYFTKKGGWKLVDMTGFFNRSVTSHGDELQYLFFKGVATSDEDLAFSKVFIKLWVSFAYTGKPTSTWGSAKVWPFVEAGSKNIKYYQIDDDTSLIDEPFQARMDIWADLMANEWNELEQEGFIPPENQPNYISHSDHHGEEEDATANDDDDGDFDF